MSHQQRLMSTESAVDDESTDLTTRPSWALPSNEDGEGGERTYSRRRSLECTSVEIQIVDTELTQDHIMYVIQAASGIKKWTVYRRFRDFYFLDKQLRKCFPKIKIPSLPPKRFFGSSTDKEFVDSRKEQLESYLTTLVGIQSIWTRNELALFLNNDANSMMFIWNFERMRRMQDMLSSMTIENQTETAKLTSELSGARDQVIALQDRLSRMEMLFLQQATGVASEQLSSNVLRTLSGVNNTLSRQLVGELTEEHNSLYESSPGTAAPVSGSSVAANDEDIVRQNLIEDTIQAHVSSGKAMSADEVVRVLRLTRESDESHLAAKLSTSRAPEDMKTVAMSIQLQEALRISNEIFDEKFVLSPSTSKQSLNSRVSEADLSRLLTPRNQATVSMSKSERELYSSDLTASWIPLLLTEVDSVLGVLSPTIESLTSRHKVFEYVRSVVSSTLGVQLFPTGSFVSHTFLPDGDLDTTAFVLRNDDDQWFVRVNEALCMSAFNCSTTAAAPSSKNSSFDTNPETTELLDRAAAANPPVTISNVSFVNGEIKMIKSMIDSVSVDISVNQISALYAQVFIEKLDAFIGKDHLFKRSILLTKAWCQYESPRHTHGSGSLAGNARDGRISSMAMIVMLTWVFNSEGSSITHPLQALGHFLRIFSSFDWDSFALTVKGVVSASDLSVVPTDQLQQKSAEELFFPAEFIDEVLARSVETYKMSTSPSVNSSHSSYASVGNGGVAGSDDTVSVASMSLDGGASVTNPTSPKVSGSVNAWVVRSAFPEGDRVYQQGLLNIMDPVAPSGCCCLTRNLDAQGFDAITSALREGYKHFQSMCDSFAVLQSKLLKGASEETKHDEAIKTAKVFLLNTIARATSLTQSISRNLAKVNGDSASTNAVCLDVRQDELEFSLSYAELILGGKVNQDVLIQLIVQILVQKGQMPVGEIGKNLQTITGCDTLSKRLKDQFSGLKKAIELSNCPRLRVGTEHPFNPIVVLLEPQKQEQQQDTVSNSPSATVQPTHPLLPSFNHSLFVFTPVLAMATLTSQNIKEAASQMKGSGSKNTFRRQPPYFMTGGQSFDSMSVMTQSTRGGGGASVSGGGDNNYIFNKRSQTGSSAHRINNKNPQSPGGRYAGSPRSAAASYGQQHQQQQGFQGGGIGAMIHGQQVQMMGDAQQQQHVPMMYATTVDGTAGGYVPVLMNPQSGVGSSATAVGGGYASPISPNLYQQQQQMHLAYLQQQQMYANYAAASMAASSGSLGSSYGQSMSPGGLSYMHIAEQQNALLRQQHQQQQQLMMQQQQSQQAEQQSQQQRAHRSDA